MDKKKMAIIVIVLIIVVAVVFAIVGNYKTKKQEEKLKKDDERDKAAFKIINNACDNLMDEEGNYNIGAKETEVVCEKGFCHITYQGENYGITCSER